MKKKIVFISMMAAMCLSVRSQGNLVKSYRNFPVIVTVNFHSLSLPFKDFKSNFSNVGFGLGTEVSHNGRQNWVQQFSINWWRNKNAGNGLLISTQTVWRPDITGNFFTEIKAGLGYNYSFSPVKSYKQENGKWVPAGYKGKGMFAVPVGISVGYYKYSANTYAFPFISYQLLLLTGYNKSIPIVPETLLQAGAAIH